MHKNQQKVVKTILDKKIKIISVVTIVSILITLSVIYIPVIKEKIENKRTYDFAMAEIEKGSYMVALMNLKDIKDYKDVRKQIDNVYLEIYELVPEMIEKDDFNERYSLNYYLNVLSELPKYEKEANEMKRIVLEKEDKKLAAEQDKLRYTAPYEGMMEDSISYSEWGPPTEVMKELNYDSIRDDRRVKHYKWIERDNFGRIVKIKTLMVKQGVVWGEPHISHYYPQK